MNEIIRKYSYHLPSDEEQLRKFAEEIRKQTIKDVLSLGSGEVINGILTGAVLIERIQRMK